MELRDYWMPKICKQFMSNDYYDDCFDFDNISWNVNYWKTVWLTIVSIG